MKKRKSKVSWDNSLPEDSHLPPELVREVLARLPVKTLLKFRCVCKLWCSIIDSSDFISLHLRLYNNNMSNSGNARLLFLQTLSEDYMITIRRSDNFRQVGRLGRFRRSFFILGSCNGLMLTKEKKKSRLLKLWNISCRRSLILPDLPTQHSINNAEYVLGFAPSSNDYKVLATKCDVGDIAVYSLSDRRWRVKTHNVNDCGLSWLGRYRTHRVFSGGALYWVGCDQYEDKDKLMDEWLSLHSLNYDFEKLRLFSYDFDVEEFRSAVKLPDAAKDSMVWFTLPLGESIAVFTMSSENTCIWVMEKDGREDPWSLWFSGEPNLDACNLLKSRIMCFWTYTLSKIIYVQKSTLFFVVQTESGNTREKLISYNLTDHTIQHLAKSLRGSISFETYVETLVLHKDIEGQTAMSSP